jgi:acetylornithine deacetylase
MRIAHISERDVLDALQQLVRIPSVNPSLAPDEGHGEAAIAAFATEWLNARGVRAWVEQGEPGRPNAVAQIGKSEPTLVLCAHLDTVGTVGMQSPFEPRLENGRVYGRGTYDMKGSAAAIMAAAVALERTGFAGRVLVALVADEEYASLGAIDFVRRHRADGCIVTEPADGRLIVGHKGFVWARITTAGRAAHGSRWDLGVSAIGRMGRIIAALEEFDRSDLRFRVHPLVGPASMHCARVTGGTGLSTYAPQCCLEVERRTLPGESTEQVVRELKDVILRSGEEASVECFFDRPPLTCDPESAVARAVRQAIADVTGRHAEEAGVQYWMDAAIFAEAGIPTVNYGPTGAGAHEVVEWVDLDSVVICANVLGAAAIRFCQEWGP